MRKEIKKIVDKMKKNKEVQAVYLFGSYAGKKTKPYSDVDICAVTRDKLQLEKKADIASDFLSEKIDLSIFWDLPLAVRFRVLKEGKLLYCKNNLFLHRAKVNTMKRYMEFRPVIDRYIKRVLGA